MTTGWEETREGGMGEGWKGKSRKKGRGTEGIHDSVAKGWMHMKTGASKMDWMERVTHQ